MSDVALRFLGKVFILLAGIVTLTLLAALLSPWIGEQMARHGAAYSEGWLTILLWPGLLGLAREKDIKT